jgi:hypothetical protein
MTASSFSRAVVTTEIQEVAGGLSHGPARALRVTLGPMEVQILGRDG